MPPAATTACCCAARTARSTVPVRSRYRVNNAVAMLDSVLGGAGMSLQPTWMVAELLAAGTLLRVLPRHTGPAQEVHLLYAPRRHQPLRVRMLVDFLAERLAQAAGASRRQ
jgi:DNA-binding transcriptional LysR family regulator